MNQSIRSYVAEFIGTFTLVFFGTAAAALSGLVIQEPTRWLGISLTFGLTLAVLVLVIGPVSGCHVNPAVTLAVALAKRMKWNTALGYVISQCLGAIAASGLLLTLLKGIPGFTENPLLGANSVPDGVQASTLLILEMLMTALFVMTILTVTRGDAALPNTKSPGFAALAIGGMLLVIHLVGVPLHDASVNPARSLGPALMLGPGSAAMNSLWVFIVGPFIGSFVGLVFYNLIHQD